jgi:hypothetical protein
MLDLIDGHVFYGTTDLGVVADLSFVGNVRDRHGCFVVDGLFIPYDPDNPAVSTETTIFEIYFEAHKNDPTTDPPSGPAPETLEQKIAKLEQEKQFLVDELAAQNQAFSNAMDYIFSVVPELQ